VIKERTHRKKKIHLSLAGRKTTDMLEGLLRYCTDHLKPQNSNSQLGATLFPRGPLSMSRDIVVINRGVLHVDRGGQGCC